MSDYSAAKFYDYKTNNNDGTISATLHRENGKIMGRVNCHNLEHLATWLEREAPQATHLTKPIKDAAKGE